MAGYEEKFTDSGEVRWLPYLMYFHPSSYASPTVNTDTAVSLRTGYLLLLP